MSSARVLCLCLLLSGCHSFGPRTMETDQLDYATALGQSWKNQMLANVVKMRFVDMPVFMDVGQIVSGYTLETTVNGSITFNLPPSGDDTRGFGASGKFTDRPTITYAPKIGEDYLRSLLDPVEPRAVLALIAVGYSPDLLFNWTVESINGVKNYTTTISRTGMDAAAGDVEYLEVMSLIGELQMSGHIAFQVVRNGSEGEGDDLVLVFRSTTMDAQTTRAQQRLREILGVSPDLDRLRIRYAPFAMNDDELAIQTRSIIQMLFALSRHIDVPAAVLHETRPSAEYPAGAGRPFTVRSGNKAPDDAYASFLYRDHWYWIDHDDIQSKRVFTLMMFITTLTNRAGAGSAPVLTIPTG